MDEGMGLDDDRGDGGDLPWLVGALTCVVLSPVAAALSRSATGSWFVVLVVAQALTTGLAFAIPQVRARSARRREVSAEERELEARVDTRVTMNDALDPIVRLLGNVAMERDDIERGQLRAQAVPLVLKTAAEFIGPERARASWFKLEAGPPRRLDPVDSVGRAGSVSTVFEAGTPAGDAAIALVLDDGELLCPDTEAQPPLGWDASTRREYRCFIAVSVIASDTAFGMVTLDALEPDSLDAEDMALLRLMAGLLAIALSAPPNPVGASS